MQTATSFCKRPSSWRRFLRWSPQLKLSALGYHRVRCVARTLADLDNSEGVRRLHVAEALSYRRIAPGR